MLPHRTIHPFVENTVMKAAGGLLISQTSLLVCKAGGCSLNTETPGHLRTQLMLPVAFQAHKLAMHAAAIAAKGKT